MLTTRSRSRWPASPLYRVRCGHSPISSSSIPTWWMPRRPRARRRRRPKPGIGRSSDSSAPCPKRTRSPCCCGLHDGEPHLGAELHQRLAATRRNPDIGGGQRSAGELRRTARRMAIVTAACGGGEGRGNTTPPGSGTSPGKDAAARPARGARRGTVAGGRRADLTGQPAGLRPCRHADDRSWRAGTLPREHRGFRAPRRRHRYPARKKTPAVRAPRHRRPPLKSAVSRSPAARHAPLPPPGMPAGSGNHAEEPVVGLLLAIENALAGLALVPGAGRVAGGHSGTCEPVGNRLVCSATSRSASSGRAPFWFTRSI